MLRSLSDFQDQKTVVTSLPMKQNQVFQNRSRLGGPANFERGGLANAKARPVQPQNQERTNGQTRPNAATATYNHVRSIPAVSPSGGSGFNLNHYEEYLGTSGTAALGSGCFGTVKRYRHIHTGKIIAIKVVQKAFLMEHKMLDQMKREIQIHSTLKHPNIVGYVGHCETRTAFYLGMEYANGGHLFKKLRDNVKFSSRRSAYYLQQVLAALNRLHTIGVIHRDLKPENLLLFVDDRGNETLKLSDFGWSNETLVRKSMAFNEGQQNHKEARQTFCGTREYLSPEMLLAEPHSFALDMWGLGVLAFEMLTGSAPFEGSSLFSKILDGKVEFPIGLDPDAVHFIKLLLRRNPAERPTASQALKNIFIRKYCGNEATPYENSRPTNARHQIVNESPVNEPVERRLEHKAVDKTTITRHPHSSHTSEGVYQEAVDVELLKAECRQSKSKVHVLQKKYTLAQEQLISVENELHEQSAKYDRLIMVVMPGLKQCLKSIAVVPNCQRRSDASDITIMMRQLVKASSGQSVAGIDRTGSLEEETNSMPRVYGHRSSPSDEDHQRTKSPILKSDNMKQGYWAHDVDLVSGGRNRRRQSQAYRGGNQFKSRRRMKVGAPRSPRAHLTTTPRLLTDSGSREKSSPVKSKPFMDANVLATQAQQERNRTRQFGNSDDISGRMSYETMYTDTESYSDYSDYSDRSTQITLPTKTDRARGSSWKESHRGQLISSKVLSVTSGNNTSSQEYNSSTLVHRPRVVDRERPQRREDNVAMA